MLAVPAGDCEACEGKLPESAALHQVLLAPACSHSVCLSVPPLLPADCIHARSAALVSKCVKQSLPRGLSRERAPGILPEKF